MHSRPRLQYPPEIRHCTLINVPLHGVNFQFCHIPNCDFRIWRVICEFKVDAFDVVEEFFGLCPFIRAELPFLACCDDADYSVPA